ncbi:MAG: SpoIIE family protein phosphatase [Ignavibacteriae bacterium]|nr:SpoIIE family protein phosphatase [Ignavibacteriota bacterium]
MRFLDKYSEGTIRAFIVTIGIYSALLISLSFVETMFTDRQTIDDCLWVNEYNGVKQDTGLYIIEITPEGVAANAGLKDGDLLIKINGESFGGEMFKAQDILNRFNNETITYTVIRDGKVMDFNIWVYEYFNTRYFIFALLSFCFLFVGFLVGYSKPKEFISQLFFLLGATSPGLLLFGTISYESLGAGSFVLYNYILLSCFFTSILWHFFLTYPIKYEFNARKSILLIIYLVNFAPVVSYIIERLLFPVVTGLNNNLKIVLTGVYIFGAIVTFIYSYSKLDNPVQKKSLNIILAGLILGGLGFAYFFIMIYVIRKPYFLVDPIYFAPLFLVLAIPISFGYSIFKYRILDTEFIVKKGLVFGILTTFIIGAYLTIVYLLNSLLSDYITENRQLLTILTIVIITLTFDYVNNKAREFVDKQFYRERYNYRKSLLSFSQELPYINNINEILKKLSTAVHNSMGIKSFDVLIFDSKYTKLISRENEPRFRDLSSTKHEEYTAFFEAIFKMQRTPVVFSEANLTELSLSEENKALIREAKIFLSVPIFLKGNLIGSMNFGEKPSGKAYSDEDIDLLKTLASQSAIAIENARLQQEELNKQRIEKELLVARNIQNTLLPKERIRDERIEVSWLSKPAKFIGGDFYDLIKIDEDKYLVVVADVSGKGIPAALYMSKVQAMIQIAASVFKTPREILIEVNRQFLDKLEKNCFVTVIAALFDFKEMKVKFARAGHNPALYSQNGTIEMMQNKGIGLGVGDQNLFEMHLEEKEIDLTPNNLFVLYSDGLTEAMNSVKEEFGLDRLMQTISPVRYDSSDQIIHTVVDSVQGFTKDAVQHDDITLVIVKTK